MLQARILPACRSGRQASVATKRFVARHFWSNIESLDGTGAASNSSDAKTKLVEAQLEMVRPAWLLQHGAAGRGVCCLSRFNRIQRRQID